MERHVPLARLIQTSPTESKARAEEVESGIPNGRVKDTFLRTKVYLVEEDRF